ncbi:hypothetical protein JL720_1921 [Aureococcus anophagefferens]|nr:hypothetical protein JL720_1921 [Aureococcus anophagefferens]
MLHAPVLEIVGRHAKADFGDIYDGEWAKIDQSERPQAEHMLAYFLKTKTAATAASLVRSLASKGADAKEMFVKLAKMYGTYNDQGVSIRKQLAALSMHTLGGPTELQLELDDLSQLYEDTCGHTLPEGQVRQYFLDGMDPRGGRSHPDLTAAHDIYVAHGTSVDEMVEAVTKAIEARANTPNPLTFGKAPGDIGGIAAAAAAAPSPAPPPAKPPEWTAATSKGKPKCPACNGTGVQITANGQPGDGTALPDDRSALTDDRSIGDYSRAYAAVADCLANAARASGPAELSADEAHALAACGSLPPCPEGFELSFIDGGSMAHALKTAKHGPRREPSDLVTPDGTRIPVERDNHFPTFAVSIFSEGQLEEQGYRFHTTERNGESRYILRLPTGVEEAELSKSSLHGPVYRDRMLAYFERDDVSPLLPPPAPLIAPKIAERRTLRARGQPAGRRSPPLRPESAVRGSVVRLRGDGRRWVVLTADVTLHVIAYDRRHPTQRRGVPRERVSEHVHYAYDVFDTTKLLSPRKDGQPPYGGTMLLERPSHPGRASRVLPDEAARAMGIDITGIAEHDVQYVVGDGVTDVYKMQAAARIMERATMLHKDRFRDTVKGLRIKVDGTVDCAVCKISRMVKSGSARKSRTQNPPAVRRPPPPPHPPPAPPGGQPAKQRPPTLRLDLFGAHSDIPSRTRSQYFLTATLNTNPPHRVGVGLRLKSEAVGEPGGFSGLRMIYNAYAAKGIRVRIVEHDDGGEFEDVDLSTFYPFYAHVAFFDMHRSERFRTSGALGRYLGAARNYGGAIRVQTAPFGYDVLGDTCGIVAKTLHPGETFHSEPGAMVFMSNDVRMSAKFGRGFRGAVSQAVSGEALAKVEYTNAGAGPGYVGMTANQPFSTVIPVQLAALPGGSINVKRGAYMAGTPDVTASMKFLPARDLAACCCGGLPPVIQSVSGAPHGTAFLSAAGTIVAKSLQPGEAVVVDSTSIVGFENDVQFDVKRSISIDKLMAQLVTVQSSDDGGGGGDGAPATTEVMVR